MTHLPSPSGGKLKTILRWRTDNFIQTLSYFPTLLLFKQKRRGENCKLYSFTICIFIWTDFDLVSAHLRVDPRSKGYRTPSWHVYLCYLLGISYSQCANVRCHLSPAPLLCSVRSFALFQLRAVHSPPSQAAPPHQAAISLNKLSQFIGQQQQSSLWRNSQ